MIETNTVIRGDGMRSLAAGSLFSGIGGIDVAFAAAGFDIRFQVEIDDFCRKVLVKHAPRYWPNAKQFVDVRDHGGSTLPAVDVLFGGFPCFAAGTMILTREGYRPIESLAVGALVLTHTGAWRPVTSVMQREAEDTIRIQGMGIAETVTTSEHPYYVSERTEEWDNAKRRYVRRFSSPRWVDAGALTDAHYITQVLPAVETDLHSVAFWWMVGRYLADGWRVDRKGRDNAGRVVICAAWHEADFVAARIADAGYHATRVNDRTVAKFHISSNDLYRFLDQFGRHAHGKLLPGWCLALDADKAKSLLLGYLTGDGCRYKDKHGEGAGWKATTVSAALALGMALLAQRAFGIVASVHEATVKDRTAIEGRAVNQRKQYQIVIPDRQRSAVVRDGYGYKKINRLARADGTTVYNISVDGDESYIANGAIVHNCQDISLAGNGAGLDGERSGLWFEFRRIIGDIRPRVVFIENVPAITTRGGATVIASLAALGYDARWGIVGASAAGAPHERERWWCLAYATGVEYGRSPNSGIQGRTADNPNGVNRRDGPANSGVVVLAYADSFRLETGADQHRGVSAAPLSLASGAGRYVGDADDDGHDWEAVDRLNAKTARHGWVDAGRSDAALSTAQPRLAGNDDGLSRWLDRPRWPAGRNQPQHPWEPPRQIVSRGPHWRARVKALGNAVVPQVVYPFAVEIARKLLTDTA